MKKTAVLFCLLYSMLAMTGCENQKKTNKKMEFGDFGHEGVFLKEYATKQINVDQAKKLVNISPFSSGSANLPKKAEVRDTKDNVKIVLTKYASLTATVKYYVSDREEQQVRKDIYQGTDFKSLLENNNYEPFGQMNVKYVFIDDNLLSDLELQNQEFLDSNLHVISPFNEPYTYHTNEDNHLILQTHHFAELPASTGGGIGSTFKQDSEIVFDEEGKITLWQSSLGLYTSTPTGTVKEGYIFEVAFDWATKQESVKE